MSIEWEKFKVAELKEECKARNIPLTGLKLKQQYIDKLVEYDSTSQDAAPAEESVEDRTNGAFEEVEKDEPPNADSNPQSPPKQDADHDQNKDRSPTIPTEDLPLAVERDSVLPPERPAALKVEDSQDAVVQPEDDVPMADTAQEAEEIKKDDMLIPESEQIKVSPDAIADEPVSTTGTREDTLMDDTETNKLAQLTKEPTPPPIVDVPDVSARDDNHSNDEKRKRKRRSATPPPNTQRANKKAKGEHGDAVVASTPSSDSRSPIRSGESDDQNRQKPRAESTSQPVELPAQSQEERSALRDDGQNRSVTPNMDDEETTEPALHAATRSLYMRNFKRPLNVPTLRSHVLTIAQGTSSIAPGEDAIKFWYMNNIRSHAFVTFSNISAASRVRTAMHQTRFPDEPQREPLWIDFIPDDKVETWVDEETGSSRGQRNSASKFEVVYNDTGDGFEAVFQDVSAARSSQQRPSISAAATNRSSLSLRQPSYSADASKTATIASGIHPDRAALVPRDMDERRRSLPPPVPAPQKPHVDQGKGFGALDDLFSFTTAKPKLYFKTVSQDTIDDRLDMFKDLYSDRGVSGDPGMKRYTFETQDGRDEWVDNGPEFGHGKRGQDRLAGIGGRGRGGYRGRGGRGGGESRSFGGDSYRGGGRR